MTARIFGVNGSLARLAEPQGFKRFIKGHADLLNITGDIQRYGGDDDLLTFVGTINQVVEFQNFLSRCRQQGMFTNIHYDNYVQVNDFRIDDRFSIMKNKSKHAARGAYSDPEHDKESQYSADYNQA